MALVLAYKVVAWAMGHARWPEFFLPAALFCLMLAGWVAPKHPRLAQRLIAAAVVGILGGTVIAGIDLLGWIRA
ncbi:MAG TPA: hypothetical protein VF761_01955 [Gemmatimonadaceae bacterium]